MGKNIFFIFTFICATGQIALIHADIINRHSRQAPIYGLNPPGCLDAGWSIADTWTMVYPYYIGACPRSSHNQFTFREDGKISTVHHGRRKCLDCNQFTPDCHIIAFDCHSGDNQRWTLRSWPWQIDRAGERTYFSIESRLHPGRCITSYQGTHNVNFTERYSTHSWQLSDLVKVGEDRYQGVHVGLRLEKCTGREKQSFYLKPDPVPPKNKNRQRLALLVNVDDQNDDDHHQYGRHY